MSSPAPLPEEIQLAAVRGELQKVVKWLRKGGQVGARSTLSHLTAVGPQPRPCCKLPQPKATWRW